MTEKLSDEIRSSVQCTGPYVDGLRAEDARDWADRVADLERRLEAAERAHELDGEMLAAAISERERSAAHRAAELQMSYQSRLTYRFECAGELWEVTRWNEDQVDFEETRKNGQEDCHVSVEARLVDNHWTMGSWDREELGRYFRSDTADLLLDFLDQHGPPPPRQPPFATKYREGVCLFFKDGEGPQNGYVPTLPSPGWEWREYVPRSMYEELANALQAQRDYVANLVYRIFLAIGDDEREGDVVESVEEAISELNQEIESKLKTIQEQQDQLHETWSTNDALVLENEQLRRRAEVSNEAERLALEDVESRAVETFQLREALAERILAEWVGSQLRRQVIETAGQLVAQQRVSISQDESEWQTVVVVPDRVSLARELTSDRNEARLLGALDPRES